MKMTIRTLMLLGMFLPALAMAGSGGSISEDMANPGLTLAQVIANAQERNPNMSMGDIVAQMVAYDIDHGGTQGGSIVAAALAAAPGDYVEIVQAAVNAGADAQAVVRSALVATQGNSAVNPDVLVQAVIDSAPANQTAGIISAASQTNASIIQAVLAPTVSSAALLRGGGGSGNTSSEFVDVLTAINDIKTELAAVGLNSTEITASLTSLLTAAKEEEASVAVGYLNTLLTNIQNGTYTTVAQVSAGITQTIDSLM